MILRVDSQSSVLRPAPTSTLTSEAPFLAVLLPPSNGHISSLFPQPVSITTPPDVPRSTVLQRSQLLTVSAFPPPYRVSVTSLPSVLSPQPVPGPARGPAPKSSGSPGARRNLPVC